MMGWNRKGNVSMALVFIPQPKRMTRGAGRLTLPRNGSIGISDHELYPVAEQARSLFRSGMVAVTVGSVRDALTLTLERGLKPGGYRLTIDSTGIAIAADSVAAAYHGLQTLFQTAAQSPAGTLPALRIDDWPDFQHRGVYYDMTRGRVPKLERLTALADTLAQYKINELQLYIEHTFRFRGHPAIGKGASPLTAEDILQLDAYCQERHIELVPSLASFGHLSSVLKHPEYRHLAEDWGVGKYVAPQAKGRKVPAGWRAWSLAPANPEVYEFLDSLLAEFLPLFSSERFNACCDETFDLGFGQSYELGRRLGRGKLYLRHIKKLNALAHKYGKRMMIWGDIIRKYPELILQLPKDITLLDWAYDHAHRFNSIKDFKKGGRKFYACPGTSSWVSLFPRIHEARANIAGFAAAGKRHGAVGLLNTDWGDGGHYNFMEYSWHGYLFGAEQAWNTDADQKSFTKRFCKLFLGSDAIDLVNALNELGDVTHLQVAGYYQSVWQHIFFALPGEPVLNMPESDGFVAGRGRIKQARVRLDADLGRKSLARLDQIRAVFRTYAQKRTGDTHNILPYWIFAVNTIRHAARKLMVLGPGGKNTPRARKVLKKEMASLLQRFERLWHDRNRPSEIRITRKRYRKAMRAL